MDIEKLIEMHLRHQALQGVRMAVAKMFRQEVPGMEAIAPEVWEVCQMSERTCETVYLVMKPGMSTIRIRIDGIPGEEFEQFMAGEPGVDLYRVDGDGITAVEAGDRLDNYAEKAVEDLAEVQVPDDASSLLRGDLGL